MRLYCCHAISFPHRGTKKPYLTLTYDSVLKRCRAHLTIPCWRKEAITNSSFSSRKNILRGKKWDEIPCDVHTGEEPITATLEVTSCVSRDIAFMGRNRNNSGCGLKKEQTLSLIYISHCYSNMITSMSHTGPAGAGMIGFYFLSWFTGAWLCQGLWLSRSVWLFLCISFQAVLAAHFIFFSLQKSGGLCRDVFVSLLSSPLERLIILIVCEWWCKNTLLLNVM